jgi:tRNA(Arg) A34 adenosine deaminase TadA
MSGLPDATEPRHRRWMRLALEQAVSARARGEPPFGAVVVDGQDNVVATDHDRVNEHADMSAHAEVLAVRAACVTLGPDLRGCTLYTTCEPCPMCYGTAWLARVDAIVFGTTMARVAELTGAAQRELRIPVETMNSLSGEPLELLGGVLADECLRLFALADPHAPASSLGSTDVIDADLRAPR